MKKIIAIAVALIIIVSCNVVAFAAEVDCGFAVATDLHYVEPMANADEYFDSEYFTVNKDGSKLENESGFIIDEFLNQCADDATCDFILVPGDLTTFGRGAVEHAEQLAEKFRKFETETGKQIYVINGNHDNGATAEVNHTKFTEIYSEFGYDTAFSVDESCCSYATFLNEKYGLIALDSCDENFSLANGVSKDRLNWVKEQAAGIRESGREPLLIMHHNLLEHSPLELVISDSYIVSYPTTYASKFADWGIKLVFTGHTHLTDAVSHTSPKGNVVYDFCTNSLTQYPFQYRKFEMTDTVISYEMKNVERIDTAALSSVVSGYTAEELEAMGTDLVAYEENRLYASTEKMVKDAITPEGLGIDDGSLFYGTVNSACDRLHELFSMNLYGENSLSSLAAAQGITIPESEYNNVWEAGIQVYFDFSAGKKTFGYDSPEINIVLGAAQLALNDLLPGVSDEIIWGAVDEVAANEVGGKDTVTNTSQEVFGGASPQQSLIISIVLPFADLYLNEGDGVDNISGEIPGYHTESSGIANVFDSVSQFFSRLIRYIELFLGTING